MIRFREVDKLLIISTFLLLAAGFVMLYSTTYITALKRYGDEYRFVNRQMISLVIAFIFFYLATRIPYQSYRGFVYLFLIISALLLILVFVPGIGYTAGGARRWLKIGSITFQPSEFAKLSVVIYLAYSLSKKHEKIKTFSIGFLPHVLIPCIILFLIYLEKDLGCTISLGAIAVFMMITAGVRIRYILGAFLLVAPVLYYLTSKNGYVLSRLTSFIDPWKDPSGSGYQIIQSFLAFGVGGINGVGIGEGKQKLFYLPEAHTDFIFSVIGEEAGLIGVGFIIFLYLIFLISGIRISLSAPDLYGTYLAVGLTFLISLQAVVNMGVVTGLLPTKGLALPFISYGGTSLIVNMAAVGILLNIYKKGQENI